MKKRSNTMDNRKTILRKVISIFLVLLISISSVASLSNTVYAEGKTKADYRIKLSSKSDATAEVAIQLDEYLSKGKTVDIYVKGSKTNTGKTIKTLQKKVQKANTLDVIFTTQKAVKSGKSYIYKIGKREVRLYRYTTRFIKMMWEEALEAAKKAQADSYDPENRNYEENNTDSTRFEFSYYGDFSLEGEQESFKNMMDAILNCRYFCELSSAQKLFIIDTSNYFYKYTFGVLQKSSGPLFMDYDYKYRYKIFKIAKNKPDQVMKSIYNNTAKGVCMDFVTAEILLFKQLGIKAYYLNGDGHAWSAVKVTNSRGKKFYIPFDYFAAIYSPQELKKENKNFQKAWKYMMYNKDRWKSNPYNNILWKVNNKRPADVPSKMNYSWDDII